MANEPQRQRAELPERLHNQQDFSVTHVHQYNMPSKTLKNNQIERETVRGGADLKRDLVKTGILRVSL